MRHVFEKEGLWKHDPNTSPHIFFRFSLSPFYALIFYLLARDCLHLVHTSDRAYVSRGLLFYLSHPSTGCMGLTELGVVRRNVLSAYVNQEALLLQGKVQCTARSVRDLERPSSSSKKIQPFYCEDGSCSTHFLKIELTHYCDRILTKWYQYESEKADQHVPIILIQYQYHAEILAYPSQREYRRNKSER